jgi:hypothetical protein
MRITAHQNLVGIFTTTKEILIWRIGGPLESVDNSGLNDYLANFYLTQALVVFHPLETSCFFVVYEATLEGTVIKGKHTYRIIVSC